MNRNTRTSRTSNTTPRRTATKRRARRRNTNPTPSRSALPAALNYTNRNVAPKLWSLKNATVIRHRELVTSIRTTTKPMTLPINPGISATFPWAATIANSFESYEVRNLEFQFLPAVGTTTDGTIMMAIDFDPNDPPPENVQTLLAMQGAVRSSVWQTATLRTTRQNLRKHTAEKFVRAGIYELPNKIGYDIGNLNIWANTGTPDMYIGDIFVSYEIHLRTPQIRQTN